MSSFSSSEEITIVVRPLCRAAGVTVDAAEDVEELEELEIEITLGVSEVFPLVGPGFLNSGYKLGSYAICLRRRSIAVGCWGMN